MQLPLVSLFFDLHCIINLLQNNLWINRWIVQISPYVFKYPWQWPFKVIPLSLFSYVFKLWEYTFVTVLRQYRGLNTQWIASRLWLLNPCGSVLKDRYWQSQHNNTRETADWTQNLSKNRDWNHIAITERKKNIYIFIVPHRCLELNSRRPQQSCLKVLCLPFCSLLSLSRKLLCCPFELV